MSENEGYRKGLATREEMREIFLHCGAYCGAPAALDAFKVAKQVFAEDAGS